MTSNQQSTTQRYSIHNVIKQRKEACFQVVLLLAPLLQRQLDCFRFFESSSYQQHRSKHVYSFIQSVLETVCLHFPRRFGAQTDKIAQ